MNIPSEALINGTGQLKEAQPITVAYQHGWVCQLCGYEWNAEAVTCTRCALSLDR